MVEGIAIPRSAPRGPFLALLCLVALSFPALSYAEEPPPTPISGSLVMLEDDAMAGFPVVEEKELSTIRGGEGPVLNLQELKAIVSGNTVEGTVTTGDSNIGAGAFSNLDGISSVVINTGNNVSIQNSTIVNIVIEE